MPDLTLAQSVLDPKLWFYIALLFTFIFVGAIIIFAIRRSLFTHNDAPNPTGGGLLEHLDHMHKSGKITKEEYDTTRASIIDKAAQRLREQDQSEPNDSEPHTN